LTIKLLQNRLLKVCYVPSLNRLLFFLLRPLTVPLKQQGMRYAPLSCLFYYEVYAATKEPHESVSFIACRKERV
jgi:hypothetical protein